MRTGHHTGRIILLIAVGLLLAYYAFWMMIRYSLFSITDVSNLLQRAWYDTQFVWNALITNPGQVFDLLGRTVAQLPIHLGIGLIGVTVFVGIALSIVFGKHVSYHADVRQAVDGHIDAILMRTPGYTPNASTMQRCVRCGSSPPHPHRTMFYFGAWHETGRSTSTHEEPTYRTVTRFRRTWNSVSGEYDEESYDEEVFDGMRTVTTVQITETFKSDGRFPLYLCTSCASRIIAADRGRGAAAVAGNFVPRLIGALIVAVIIYALWGSGVNMVFSSMWGAGIDVMYQRVSDAQRSTYILAALAGIPVGLMVGFLLVFRGITEPLKRASPSIVQDFLLRTARVMVRSHQREVSTTPTAFRERTE